MAALHAQAEAARARPGRENLAQGGRDGFGILDEVRRPAMPAPGSVDLDRTPAVDDAQQRVGRAVVLQSGHRVAFSICSGAGAYAVRVTAVQP